MAKLKFQYVARNDTGRQLKGTVEAANESDATGRLRQRGLAVVSIQEKPPPKEIRLFGEPAKKASQADLAMFTRQMATMLSAGIPLLEAIEILAEQVAEDNQGFGTALLELADAVRGGTALSEAMTHYPKVFPDIYINMVKAGEASGQMDAILNRLAEYMEASESLKREIKSAMTYPVISLAMILLIAGYLLIGVVPKFATMFTRMKVDLPIVTVGVMATSDWLQANVLLVIVAIVAVFVGYRVARKNERFCYLTDTLKLKMPVFGQLSQKVLVSRFTRTFSTLLSSGVPLLGALEIVANTSGNRVLAEAVMDTRECVREGQSLTAPLEECWVFPPMVVRMISIGEKSGALETLLSKVADFYDEQVHATVKALTSLIEPIMIGIMGFIVGLIVLAIFWPILEMQKALGQQAAAG
ncbi:MAG: type II secretion system F family protein [Planctomycetota bacterium]